MLPPIEKKRYLTIASLMLVVVPIAFALASSALIKGR